MFLLLLTLVSLTTIQYIYDMFILRFVFYTVGVELVASSSDLLATGNLTMSYWRVTGELAASYW